MTNPCENGCNGCDECTEFDDPRQEQPQPHHKGEMMPETYKVNVIDARTGEVVKTMETVTKRAAERIENGLNINMNHDHYYTEINEPKEPYVN